MNSAVPPLPAMTDAALDSSSGFLSMRTVAFMIALAFVMHAGAVAFTARSVRDYRGAALTVWAAVSLAARYVLIFFVPPGILLGITTNVLTVTTFLLIYFAIDRFVGVADNLFVVAGAAIIGYVGLVGVVMLRVHVPAAPSTMSALAIVPLCGAGISALLRGRTDRFRAGAWLTGLAVGLFGVLSLLRAGYGMIDPRGVAPGSSWSNILDVFSFYVLSYCWIAGFILMTIQRLHADLHDLAMHDTLTGAHNRRSMEQLLIRHMKRARTSEDEFAVLLLDVDRFKQINDNHGHHVGDNVLRWLTEVITASLRPGDLVARWGGEEFLVLLPGVGLDEARATADRLRLMVATTSRTSEIVPGGLTFSGGVASSRNHTDVEEIYKHADRALYRAKESRNLIVCEPVPVQPASPEVS